MWYKLFVLNMQFDRRQLGLSGTGPAFLGVSVVPMGWINAFGLVQYAHRRMLTVGTGGPVPPLSTAREIRKDRALPVLRGGDPIWADAWQVYCDDFDEIEIVQNEKELKQFILEAGEYPQRAAAADEWWEAPTSDHKSGDRQLQANRLGLRVDGLAGRLSHTGERCGHLIGITTHILATDWATAKDLQVLAGHWTHAIEVKRETACAFDKIWLEIVEGLGRPARPLKPRIRREITMVLCLLPLMQADLRLEIDPRFTVSDASEVGGGVCVATGLTPDGVEVFRNELALVEGKGRDVVGLISCFEGIGGDRRAFELLGIEVAAHMTIELDGRARKVTATAWPGAEVHEDVRAVGQPQIQQWLQKHPHLRLLFVIGGSPCQGVTGLNAGAKGMADPRTLLVYDLVRIYVTAKECAPEVDVGLLVENVSSMDQHGTDTLVAFNQLMGSIPSDIEACNSGDMRRKRRYWHSWPITETPDAVIEAKGLTNEVTLVGTPPGYVLAFDDGAVRAPEATGPFATFVRAIRRKAPPPSPRGIDSCSPQVLQRWRDHEFRYPPYQYKDDNGVWGPSGWRPLNAGERERRMGFEPGHTLAAVDKLEMKQSPQAAEDIRCALVGNAFYAPAVAWLVGHKLQQAGIISEVPTMDQCWGKPTKMELDRLQARLNGDKGEADAIAEEVIRQVHRNSSGKGSDVRLATGIIFNPGMWPRRAIAAGRWNWKVVVAFPMRGRHINVQELESVLSALKWRTRSRLGPGRRSVHFIDSQVCMAVLAKGRSSSSQVRQVLIKINALILASNLAPAMIYVRSADNPADAPSRWTKWGDVRKQ